MRPIYNPYARGNNRSGSGGTSGGDQNLPVPSINNGRSDGYNNNLPTVVTCSSTRGLGVAATTEELDQRAMKFYNIIADEYSTSPLKRFQDLNTVDICNENVNMILCSHARRCREGWIPKGWYAKGGFLKQNQQQLSIISILKYIQPLLQLLKRLCPDHMDLVGDDQEWWKRLKSDLKRGYEKKQIRGEDETFNPKCSALYFINNPLLVRFCDEDMHMLKQIDLHFIVK